MNKLVEWILAVVVIGMVMVTPGVILALINMVVK